MIIKTVPISTRIVISNAMNKASRCEYDEKSMETETTRWPEFPNGGKPWRESPALLLLYIHDLPDVICNIVIYADDNTVYSKCDQASDLWQELEFGLKFN